MTQEPHDSTSSELNNHKESFLGSIRSWELMIILRFLLIIYCIFVPCIRLFLLVGGFQLIPFMMSIGGCVLTAKFVVFEKRKMSIKRLKQSLYVLYIAMMIIEINITSGIIISAVKGYPIAAISNLVTNILFIFSIMVSIKWEPFHKLISTHKTITDTQNKPPEVSLGKKPLRNYPNIFYGGSLIVLVVSILFLFIPTTIYTVATPTTARASNGFGIWTYGKPLDWDREGTSMFIDNDTLQLLHDRNVYFVYGTNYNNIGDGLVSRLTRCKDFGVEVHLSITPTREGDDFINIWTFENVRYEINETLHFLRQNNLIGDPITHLVYDMEGMAWAHFPNYGWNATIYSQIQKYEEVQQHFWQFNQYIREEYGLNIRICTDIYQAVDLADGDNDITSFWGLIFDNNSLTTYSYMVYRRDNLGQNYLLNHCRMLNSGGTIIQNAWKFEGHFCWENLACAIQDAKATIMYQNEGKSFKYEMWALWYFLQSYGLEGLQEFITELTSDWTQWEPVALRNYFPYSTYAELLFIGTTYLDLFGPLFRLLYHAY